MAVLDRDRVVHRLATTTHGTDRGPDQRPGEGIGRRPGTDPVAWAAAVSTITLGLWALTGGASQLLEGGLSTLLAVGRLSGLVAALAAVLGLILTARPRWLERAAGLDRLIGWHRITGMTAAFGVGLHVVVSLVAAGGGPSGSWTALADLVSGTPWFTAALVAAGLFVLISVASWQRVRRTMAYETWHMIHLAGYLAVALGFPHQLFSGSTFTASDVARWWWIALYVATLAIVLHGRLGGIAAAVLRPRTIIARIIPEGPGVASLVITGPGVDHLNAKPGQFVSLRVLTPDLWWQAHPYSLSAAPQPGALRLTVKALGDASTRTIALKPGVRVLLEGPYGTLSVRRAQGRPVLLIGAGVGLAPMRALLEASTPEQRPIVLARAHSPEDLPLASELDGLARARGGKLIPVTGARTQFPQGNPFTAAALRANIGDLEERDVFVCGPEALQGRVLGELRRAGVPRNRIHSERFAW
ncbi:MAG: ferredoxin reductase family protein [Candidatus Nanopelagicales bacterium]